MISKELLSEVLEIEIVDYSINENQVRINQLWHEDNPLNRELELFNTSYGCKVSINIYELAFKCKEWAYKRGFLIGSNCRQGITVIDINTHTVLNHFDVDIEDFTEFEIKACQWILENLIEVYTKQIRDITYSTGYKEPSKVQTVSVLRNVIDDLKVIVKD